jgi:hypothetical protein
MTIHHPAEILVEKARIVPAPALRRNRHERAFDLHPGVHFMVIGAWMGFIAILLAAFMGPDLVVPAGICILGAASLFVTPGLWARVKGDDGLPRQSWSEFMSEGVETYTGHLKSKEALAQIMILPALLIGLALFMAAVKLSL